MSIHFPYALPLLVGFAGLMLWIAGPYPRQMRTRMPLWFPMMCVALMIAAFVVPWR